MRRLVGVMLAIGLCGCAAGSEKKDANAPPAAPTIAGPAAPSPSQPVRDQPAHGEPVASEPACSLAPATLRLRVDAGQTMPTGTGLTITNEGASHDNYGPAGFDILISLHFRRDGQEARRLTSFRDHRTQQVLGHCYRIVDADAGVVLLEVSALPEPSRKPKAEADPGALEGVGGTPPPGAASCTVTDDNGPLPGGNRVTHGCAPNEICMCESRAGYSCGGHCVPTRQK